MQTIAIASVALFLPVYSGPPIFEWSWQSVLVTNDICQMEILLPIGYTQPTDSKILDRLSSFDVCIDMLSDRDQEVAMKPFLFPVPWKADELYSAYGAYSKSAMVDFETVNIELLTLESPDNSWSCTVERFRVVDAAENDPWFVWRADFYVRYFASNNFAIGPNTGAFTRVLFDRVISIFSLVFNSPNVYDILYNPYNLLVEGSSNLGEYARQIKQFEAVLRSPFQVASGWK